MPVPYADLQNLNQTSPFIELFRLDTTALGGSIYSFTANVDGSGNSLVFGGVTYAALPILAEGFDFVGSGQLPRPKLTVSNVNKTLLSAVVGMGDLVGAKVYRYRTYEKYLDGQPGADATKYLGPDVYVVNQKTGHNKNAIQWELGTIIDRMGIMLPRRQFLKDKGFPGIARTRVR